MNIVVIGASGFVGKHLALKLLDDRHSVRCMVRNTNKVKSLNKAGCQVVKGDIFDTESVNEALKGTDAVYISIHTLSPQQKNYSAEGDFMDIEKKGIINIVKSCQANGVRRVIYVTSLGIGPDSRSAWTRGRWETEQYLLNSGLDVTVIRPGQIMGKGGQGFQTLVAQAKKRSTIILGTGKQKLRGIYINDLIYYLHGVLNTPSAYGKTYSVGCDDVLTMDEMVDLTSELLGKKPPLKIHLNPSVLHFIAPVIELISRMPKGSVSGAVDAMICDLDGDPTPIRKILPRIPIQYREALMLALRMSQH